MPDGPLPDDNDGQRLRWVVSVTPRVKLNLAFCFTWLDQRAAPEAAFETGDADCQRG